MNNRGILKRSELCDIVNFISDIRDIVEKKELFDMYSELYQNGNIMKSTYRHYVEKLSVAN